MGKLSERRWETALLIAVLCVAAALRLYRIQDESVWFDEVVSTAALDQPTLSAFFEALRANDPTVVPGYFTLEYLVAQVSGGGVLAVRILSVTLSLVTVALLYSWGRCLFGGMAGLFAAALLTLSRTHIYFSQEARMYALLLPLALLSMMTFTAALNTNRRLAWAANILVNACIVWTHLLGCILPLTEGLFLLVFSGAGAYRRTIGWTLGHLPFLAPLCVWVNPQVIGYMQKATHWIPMPSWESLFDHYFYYCSGSTWVFGLIECLGPHLPFLSAHALPGLFMFLASAWLVVWTFRHRVRMRFEMSDSGSWHLRLRSRFALPSHLRQCPGYSPRVLLLLFFFFIVPPLALFLASVIIRPYFVNRYVFYPCFALCILAGAGTAAVPRGWKRTSVAVLLLGSLAILLPDLRRPLRTDSMTASRIINAYGSSHDFVFVESLTEEGLFRVGKLVGDIPVWSSDTYTQDALAAAEGGVASWVIIPSRRRLAGMTFDEMLEKRGYKADRFLVPGRVPLAVYRIIPDED